MRVGFLIESDFVLKFYYSELRKHADCWWGITDSDVFKEMEVDTDKIVYKNCRSTLRDFKLSIYPKLDRRFKSRKKSRILTGINSINDNSFFKNVFLCSYKKKVQKLKDKIRPDIWISDCYGLLDYTRKDTYWVQTLHAITIKKYVINPLLLKYDLILLPGKFHERLIINRFGADIKNKLRIIGWPRHDGLINNSYNKREILTKLGLTPDCKTVLYAPSWPGYDRSDFFIRWFDKTEIVFENLCKYCKAKKLNLIVKLHPTAWNMISNKRIRKIARKYGVYLLPDRKSYITIDPNPYLFVSDVLISDVSGIVHEYLVLDRPIIYIEPDVLLDPWDEIEVPKEFRAGFIVKEPGELLEAIEDSLKNPGKFSERRNYVLNELFAYQDVKSSLRGANEILKFAKEKGIKK